MRYIKIIGLILFFLLTAGLTTYEYHGYLELHNGSISAGSIKFYEDSDNGPNYIELIGAASLSADGTITLPTDTEIAQTGPVLNTAGQLSVVETGVSGTLILDDGTTEKITLVFTNGILTSRTVEATTSTVTADWTD